MGAWDRGARRAQMRLAVLVGAVVVVFSSLIGWALSGSDDSGDARGGAKGSPSPSTSQEPSTTPRPTATKAWNKLTPATARPRRLDKGESRSTSGLSIRFPHSANGALSAAVRQMEERELLDDGLARRQWEAIGYDEDTVAAGVSEVRTVREQAGLPPSGGPPSGVSFTTKVEAACLVPVDEDGTSYRVYLHWSRYAQVKDKATDDDPLIDQDTEVTMAWKGGDWKTRLGGSRSESEPASYDPDSNVAFRDGWRRVDAAS